MRAVEILPPELWIIILDFVVVFRIGLLQHSNHITFPELLNQFRHAWKYYPTGISSLSNFRLVCRAFSLPFHKSRDTPIPNSTRAAFIYPSGDAQVLLQHLLAEPSRSQQIVMLDLAVHEHRNSCLPVLFDFLCENAHSLPNVQSLTLTLPHCTSTAPATPKFWSRLNNAFPRLVCLVLRGWLNTLSEPEPVIFERLRVLDFDMVLADPIVHVPMLRHAAFSRMGHYSASRFTGWAVLESLLIREADSYSSHFNWALVPRLLLLGVSSEWVGHFARLPFQHPLQHLYIYVGTVPRNDHYQDPERKDKELIWLKRVLKQLPTVKRVTLAYPPVSNLLSSSIWGDFDEEELILMGFIRDYSYTRGNHKDDRMVLQRIDIELLTEPRIGAVSQYKGIRVGWGRFCSLASRKFHF